MTKAQYDRLVRAQSLDWCGKVLQEALAAGAILSERSENEHAEMTKQVNNIAQELKERAVRIARRVL